MESVYATDAGAADAGAQARGRRRGDTNQHQFKISAGLDLIEDLTFDADLSLFWHDESIRLQGSDTEIGQELDGYLTYDYTEDVQFKVAGGVFWPDEAYKSNDSSDDSSQDNDGSNDASDSGSE